MSRTQSLDRINQSIRAVPDSSAAPPAAESEARQLAREAIQAFADELELYRRQGSLKMDDPKQTPWNEDIQAILEIPPQDVSFAVIERLSRVDPARAVALWEEVKAVAGDDLESGYLAARALEYLGGSAWGRACFLAVRTRLYR